MTREELIKVIYTGLDCQVNCDVELTCQECAENHLFDYEKKVVSNFAEWLTQKIDLRFSNNSRVWVDEYFNHTTEKLLEQLKEDRHENI